MKVSKAYIDSSLFDRDLRFYDIKRRLESFGLKFTAKKNEATIVLHEKNVELGQWAFWFDEPFDNKQKRAFYFSADDFSKVASSVEEIEKWRDLYHQVKLEESIANSLSLVRGFDNNLFKKKHGDEAFFKFLLQYLSWYASSEWEFNFKYVASTLMELAQSQDIELSITDHLRNSENEIILVLPDNEIVSLDSPSLECSLLAGQILLGSLKSYSNDEDDGVMLSWDYIIGKLHYPIGLFSKDDGNMVLHSQGLARLKILPSECLALENGATKEIEGKTYEVVKDEFVFAGHSYFALSFNGKRNVDNEGRNLISSEELGIISSSIAHELNNPIAGILASIALLQLEDDLPDDIEKTLKDMEEGAKRCRDLIQVFLGFTKEGSSSYAQRSIKESFKQSLDMLRFRMVESDCRLNILRSDESIDFKRNINPSIMTMIFYLLMNEVLTHYSHYQLVKEEQLGTINGRMKEYEDRMAFRFDNVSLKSFLEKLNNLKLLHHLFDLSLLELKIENDKIILKDKIGMCLAD